MPPDESSQDALLPAAANSSSVDAAGKKSATADAGSSAKKTDAKPKPEPKPQVRETRMARAVKEVLLMYHLTARKLTQTCAIGEH